jgi:hypothetical protein
MPKQEVKLALIPQFSTRQFPSTWVEVVILTKTKTWAMCRRKDTPGAVPFVRSVKELRPLPEKEG